MRAKPFARDAAAAGPTWVRSARPSDAVVDLEPPEEVRTIDALSEITTNNDALAVTEPYQLPRDPVEPSILGRPTGEEPPDLEGNDDSITDAMELVLEGADTSAPVILHRPTFHTAPLHTVDVAAAASPRRAPSLPPAPGVRIAALVHDPTSHSLPEHRVSSLDAHAIDPDSIDADDQSTGLFESDSNHPETHTGASSASVLEESRVFEREPPRPSPPKPAASSTLSRSIAASIEREYVGMRAVPLEREPRPQASEVVDWPPPAARPTLDAPADWSPDETRIVLDPIRRSGSHALPERTSRWGVIALDASAWLVGFLAMFLTGLVTTGSAALVVFALSVS